MQPIGHDIVRLEQVDSTNTLVLATPAWLERHGLVVLARHQTGGRGRMGRRWASLPGRQLQFSAVLHPHFPTADVPLVALVAGLAVAEAIAAALPLHPRLKWPNDVLIARRKVCGILVEGATGAGGQPRLVVGIGLNVRGPAADFPAGLHAVLTTLEEESGQPVEPEPLLQSVLGRLQALYERLAAGDKAALLDEWRRSALLGDSQRVRVRTRDGEREGVPEDLTAEGYLLVRLPDGSHVTQVSGDVDWLA
jgi:BirA family transcriptional regulator, biotin operon repressor / biotin---[acetyl-CoA-carboxylase] ligase